VQFLRMEGDALERAMRLDARQRRRAPAEGKREQQRGAGNAAAADRTYAAQ